MQYLQSLQYPYDVLVVHVWDGTVASVCNVCSVCIVSKGKCIVQDYVGEMRDYVPDVGKLGRIFIGMLTVMDEMVHVFNICSICVDTLVV